jgi:hypothetical protein
MSSKPQIRSLKKKPNPAATTTATEIMAASDKGTQPDKLKPAAIPSYTTTNTFPDPVPTTLPLTEPAPKTLTIANTENKPTKEKNNQE